LPDSARLEFDILPTDVLTNGDFLTLTAHSALVASKAVWTTYAEVQEIKFSTYTEFTDQYGATSKDVAASINCA